MSNSTPLTERYSEKILGVLGCFDRIVITGSLPDCCHVDAMKAQLLKRKMLFFDYPKLVNPLRNRLHENAKKLAQEAGVRVEDTAFLARGGIATAGGCLASQYLAAWLMWRAAGEAAAARGLHYAAPVGEKESYVARLLGVVRPFVDTGPG